ncbi:MAG: ATP-binding cassette domain-containing protein [Holosporales bacterium]|jgi:polar amino acid transport system ATP-binding protein|nr:ATP-binding cassette domain-containing protein [Holosporales bacterium]
MLKLKEVSKVFGEVVVLDHVSLSVAKSGILGLAGASGSGKSTLLRCVQGFEKPDSGEIECNGRVCFIFQDFQLFPHMNVLQNLVYAPDLKADGSARQKNEEKALALLKSLGLGDKANSFPALLSGGQKQRAALARSLMIDPDIILCDEPTSGLDVMSIADVISLLREVRSRGVTMVIASHDLGFLTEISEKVILLKNGRIVVEIDPKQHDDPSKLLTQYY